MTKRDLLIAVSTAALLFCVGGISIVGYNQYHSIQGLNRYYVATEQLERYLPMLQFIETNLKNQAQTNSKPSTKKK